MLNGKDIYKFGELHIYPCKISFGHLCLSENDTISVALILRLLIYSKHTVTSKPRVSVPSPKKSHFNVLSHVFVIG